MLNQLTDSTFEPTLTANGPVMALVKFGADWCAPCKTLQPVLEELDAKKGIIPVYDVDVDTNPRLTENFQIKSVPTIIFFQFGKEISRTVGIISKSAVERFINENIRKIRL